jgi:sporulation protein YlmC with PRC-barrel domain
MDRIYRKEAAMLLKAKGELFNHSILGRDDKVGTLRDVYLDDEKWVVRYFEVEVDLVGSTGRKVLISPFSIQASDVADNHQITVALTRKQVLDSPGADHDMPVSRLFEEAHARYYGYPFYWDGPYLWGSSPHPVSETASVTASTKGTVAEERRGELKDAEQQARTSHLRSSSEVIGYRIVATDGPLGHVEDILIDDADWRIAEVVVDTRKWLPGKHLRVPVDAVDKIDWATREMRLRITRDEIRNSPKA